MMRNYIIPKLNEVLLLPIADKLMSTNVIHYYKEIVKMNSWDRSEIEKWRSMKILDLVMHSYSNTKYYRKLFDDNNIDPLQICNFEALSKIPKLTKKLATENYQDLIPKNISEINYIKKNTGGSTGDPFNYLLDKRSWSYTVAVNWFYWNKIGYKMGNNYVALGSSSILPTNNKKSYKHNIYYWLKGKKSLNGMNMSPEIALKYLNYITKNRIRFIYGYASAIYLLAKASIEYNMDIRSIKGCISTSEILTDFYRDTIIKAFNCEIIDAYGASDGGINAFKINDGCYRVGYNCVLLAGEKHISNDYFGNLLLTDLFNYAMPLINYEIGDSAIIPYNSCSDYNGQELSKVFGRISDLIQLQNGNILTGPGFTVFFKDVNVDAYSIRQTGNMELLIEVIESENYKMENDELIIRTMKKYAGEDCEIILKKVDSFDVPASGKRRYFLSN